jgi:hypothetical protein
MLTNDRFIATFIDMDENQAVSTLATFPDERAVRVNDQRVFNQANHICPIVGNESLPCKGFPVRDKTQRARHESAAASIMRIIESSKTMHAAWEAALLAWEDKAASRSSNFDRSTSSHISFASLPSEARR